MYKIVYYKTTTLELATQRLQDEVNRLEKEGWMPQGGISVVRPGPNCFYIAAQAMVKK